MRFTSVAKFSAKISMKLLSLRDRLKIDVPGNDDLEARGDIFHHEYGIFRGSREVAHISKAWIALSDTYGIDIDDDQDQVLILACAVVIDEILDMRQSGTLELNGRHVLKPLRFVFFMLFETRFALLAFGHLHRVARMAAGTAKEHCRVIQKWLISPILKADHIP